MNEEKARKIFEDNFFDLKITPGNEIYCDNPRLDWDQDEDGIRLNDIYNAEELRALAWWIENKGEQDDK